MEIHPYAVMPFVMKNLELIVKFKKLGQGNYQCVINVEYMYANAAQV